MDETMRLYHKLRVMVKPEFSVEPNGLLKPEPEKVCFFIYKEVNYKMPNSFNLQVRDEDLQMTAETLGVWNFAKKARKVLNVLQGELGWHGQDWQAFYDNLGPAIQYAGVAFSQEEKTAFLHLITTYTDN